MCNLNNNTYNTQPYKNESIQEFQNKQQKEYIKKIKYEIVADIKSKISENPYIENIKYEFTPYKLIYNKIKRNFKTIEEELKKENISLISMKEYKITTSGFFRKKVNKVLSNEYYLIDWNKKER